MVSTQVNMSDLRWDTMPIDSDFENIFVLLEDLKVFATAHRSHTFLCADDPGIFHDPPRVARMGWTAFIDGSEDEQARMWTITLPNVSRSLAGDRGSILRKTLKSPQGRHRTLQTLVKASRSG